MTEAANRPWWTWQTPEERQAAMIEEALRWRAAIKAAGLTAAEFNAMTFAWGRRPEGADDFSRSGKWMVFCSPEYHSEVWEKIKAATEAGELGDAAKTVPPLLLQRALLTCVYTYDYEDQDDVRRVLVALRRLGFNGRLNYKTDADTGEGNYGEGVSIYVSQPGSLDFDDRRPT